MADEALESQDLESWTNNVNRVPGVYDDSRDSEPANPAVTKLVLQDNNCREHILRITFDMICLVEVASHV